MPRITHEDITKTFEDSYSIMQNPIRTEPVFKFVTDNMYKEKPKTGFSEGRINLNLHSKAPVEASLRESSEVQLPDLIVDPGEYRKLMNSKWDKAELPIMYKPETPVMDMLHDAVRRVAYEHSTNLKLMKTFVAEFKDAMQKVLFNTTGGGGPTREAFRKRCVSNVLDRFYGKITPVCIRTNLPEPTPYVNVVAIPTILYHDDLHAQYSDLLNLICMHPIWDYIARLYLNPVGARYNYDLYTICAAFTMNVSPEEVTKVERDKFKMSRTIAKYEPCAI